MVRNTYSTSELCARYKCDKSTLYRKTKKEGFPATCGRVGKENLRWQHAVHAWERLHLPDDPLNSESEERLEEEQRWDELRAELTEESAKPVTRGRSKSARKKK